MGLLSTDSALDPTVRPPGMRTLKTDILIPRNDEAWHEPPLRSAAGARSWVVRCSANLRRFHKGMQLSEQSPGPLDLDGVTAVADVALDANHTAAIYAQDGTYVLRIFDDVGIDKHLA